MWPLTADHLEILLAALLGMFALWHAVQHYRKHL